jgi:L-phenylalanine/L-methionine N-acetyltransferase
MEPITVRAAEPDDAAAIHWIASAPGVVHGTLQMPHQSKHASQERLSREQDGHYRLVAECDHHVVGLAGLTVPATPRRRHVGQIGMMVHDDWQGKGVGTALLKAVIDLADNWLNLQRIELDVYTDNRRAIRLYERHGFEIEGLMKDFAFRNGSYIDACIMGRVRDRNHT